jgi:hypothetical protein
MVRLGQPSAPVKSFPRGAGRLRTLAHPEVEGKCQSNSTLGSDIAWQAQAALGCQITRNIYSEVGCRLLYDDYRDTNSLYQVTTHGAQITVGLNFEPSE